MSYAVLGSDDSDAFVGIFLPALDDLARELRKRDSVVARKADDRVVPVNLPDLDVGITFVSERAKIARFVHRKLMQTALKMFVVQNRTADDRKVGIAADEIMRSVFDEVEKFLDGVFRHLHRRVVA